MYKIKKIFPGLELKKSRLDVKDVSQQEIQAGQHCQHLVKTRFHHEIS